MVITSLYGGNFTPDPRIVAIREKKISIVKKQLGDKYLLAVPIQRKDRK